MWSIMLTIYEDNNMLRCDDSYALRAFLTQAARLPLERQVNLSLRPCVWLSIILGPILRKNRKLNNGLKEKR